MPSKKNAFIAILIVLSKKESKQEDSDINVKIVIEVFKANDNYPDPKPNYGMNMSGKNKLFQIYL